MWITIVKREQRNPYKGLLDIEFDESWSLSHTIDTIDNKEELMAIDRIIDKIYAEVATWDYWYDRELFKVYFGSHVGLRQLSRDTKISLSSLHNSIKKYKNKIRQELGEDWEDFLNNEFDLI
jgi:hypothetical protein